MTRLSASLLSVLAAALWPAQGQAQAGPSFNCADSDTAAEAAICASPELSQLELQMFASYLRLVDAVGERRARNIADRFLERRQACGSDEACIEERLMITLRVFERRAGGDTRTASRELSEDELTGRDAPAEATAAIEAPAAEDPAPVEEAFATIAAPPVRPAWFPALAESEPEPPAAIEDELALAESAPLPEEDLALAPEPASPIEAPARQDELALSPEALAILEAPAEEALAAPEPAGDALPEEEIASAEPVESDLPLAAQAPLPSDLDALLEEDPAADVAGEPTVIAEEDPSVAAEEDPAATQEAEPAVTAEQEPATAVEEPVETASAEPVPSPEEMSGTIEGAELASASEPAPFDTPLSWAFMDLIRHQRSEIQTRLQAAGFYEGPADGSWDGATLAALEDFFASEEGASFDSTTETGSALAFDFLRSDAFAEAHGLPSASAEEAAAEAAPDPNDPLSSTDW